MKKSSISFAVFLTLTPFAVTLQAAPIVDADIDAYIQSIKPTGVSETKEMRQVVQETNGKERVAVLYTLETGNYYVQHLRVLSKVNAAIEINLRSEAGGRGRGMAKIKSLTAGVLTIEKKSYGASDPECCPSLVGEERYSLDDTTLPTETQIRPAKLSPALDRLCARTAKDLAVVIANKTLRQKTPRGPFVAKESKLIEANLVTGQSDGPIADFAVTLKSKDNYECDYEVRLEVREGTKQCRFVHIAHRMCVN